MKKIIFTAIICNVLCLSGCMIEQGVPPYWYPTTPAESIATDYEYYVDVEIYQNDMTAPIETIVGRMKISEGGESNTVNINLVKDDSWSRLAELKNISIAGEISNVRMSYNGNAMVWMPDFGFSSADIDLTGWVRVWNVTRCSPAEPGYVNYKIDMTIEFEAYNEDEGITDNIKLVIKKDKIY